MPDLSDTFANQLTSGAAPVGDPDAVGDLFSEKNPIFNDNICCTCHLHGNPVQVDSAGPTTPTVLTDSTTDPDAPEPQRNDITDFTTEATIQVGESYSSRIDSNGDRDLIRIDLDPGQYVRVAMVGDTLPDPFLRVYDAGGNQIAENDDIGYSRNSAVRIGDEVGGTFYVEAAAFSTSQSGSYTINAFEAPPPGPVDALGDGGQRTDTDEVITVYLVPDGAQSGANNEDITSEGWNNFERQRVEAALASIAAVIDVRFEITDNANADFRLVLDDGNEFLNDNGQPERGFLGFFYLPGTDDPSTGAFNGNGFGWSEAGLREGGLGYATIVHEFLHGLGLEHPHDGQNVMNGVSQPFDDFGDFNLNQGLYSTMSYNGGFGNSDSQTAGNEAGPMAFDIAALQAIYGANMETGKDNDTYLLEDNAIAFRAIWDAGGEDTLRYNGDDGVTIDLREASLRYETGGGGFLSQVGNDNGGMTIAHGVTIENALGGHGNDTIRGNDFDNGLFGRGGNDNLNTGGGNDMVEGNAGRDTITATSGTNTIYGGSGNDTINGGDDNDLIFGGSGNDQINGGNGADDLFGGRGNDTINGGGGSDRIVGGMGQDVINGNGGADVFVFEFASDSYAGSANRDQINGFSRGNDRIDLSAIDGLSFSSSNSFDGSQTGQVITTGSSVLVDIDGDGNADMEILIGIELGANDFIL